MTTVNRSAIVPYSSQQMYQLVDDINHYPEFLPWCYEAEEHKRTPDSVEASLTLEWNGLYKSFTTRNRLEPHHLIEMRLVDGPFKRLEGFWKFAPLMKDGVEQGCKVELSLEFEFLNPMVSMMFSSVFEKISQEMVGCFIERAKSVYK
jgi:ribosome-associated toxin RatA of RatAB toxin-antitoxin module